MQFSTGISSYHRINTEIENPAFAAGDIRNAAGIKRNPFCAAAKAKNIL